MNMNRYADWFLRAQWLVVAALFAIAIVAWQSAPETMPVHWSLTGQPDQYAGKIEGLLTIPAIALLLVLLLRFLPRIDPKRGDRYREFAGAYALTGLAIVGVLAVTYAMMLLWVGGIPLNFGLVIGSLVGALLVVIGAVMGSIRPNWFFGIRTPWTLSSDYSWSATHRVGRWVFVVMGLSVALAGIVQTPWALYTAMVVCLGGVLGLVAYSYVAWRDDPARLTT
jgi:uncharacterized membrane protein